MKDWPANHGETVAFEDLVDPVVAAIEGKPYEGYGLPGTAGTPATSEALTPEHMEYQAEEQGISVLHQLVGLAVSLGMEQQRRLMLGDHGEAFNSIMIGGRFRSEYAISAAVEEAIEESGIDSDGLEAHAIEFGVRSKLRDLENIKALQDRQEARVKASLEASRQRRQAMSPEDRAAEDASWAELLSEALDKNLAEG